VPEATRRWGVGWWRFGLPSVGDRREGGFERCGVVRRVDLGVLVLGGARAGDAETREPELAEAGEFDQDAFPE
jgi:hypothetical protein